MTIAMLIATIAAGLFAGAALYVTIAEHPARLESGQAVAIQEFGPSYHRAAVMQGGLAVAGLLAGVAAWALGASTGWLVWGVLLGALVPFTLAVIRPTNRRLLDPQARPGVARGGRPPGALGAAARRPHPGRHRGLRGVRRHGIQALTGQTD